jgi:predicted acylesterase/phospholipase RssA
MFAHISVLRFLEKLGAYKHIAEIWGASGGAVVSLLYSMGLDSDALQGVTDHYFGTRDLPLLLKTLGADYKHELVGERMMTTPRHFESETFPQPRQDTPIAARSTS